MSIADIRTDYRRASLSETELAATPMAQFDKWFQEARKAEVTEVNAITLATVNPQGRPSSRIVLIKEYDQRGLTWFTNYDSAKGQDLVTNPYACLLFFWAELERQVRIEGRVERISDTENDSYFYSRPLGSQQSANASAQSQVIANRDLLEQKLAAVIAEHGEHPPRPAHWGGYRLIPERLEFWQGRASRLHDRLVYQLDQHGQWQIQRLQP